jgi:hypothetical protein
MTSSVPANSGRHRAGEIVIFDKAYLDFAHPLDLFQRGVFWVTRAKENMACEVLKALPAAGRILRVKSSACARPVLCVTEMSGNTGRVVTDKKIVVSVT